MARPQAWPPPIPLAMRCLSAQCARRLSKHAPDLADLPVHGPISRRHGCLALHHGGAVRPRVRGPSILRLTPADRRPRCGPPPENEHSQAELASVRHLEISPTRLIMTDRSVIINEAPEPAQDPLDKKEKAARIGCRSRRDRSRLSRRAPALPGGPQTAARRSWSKSTRGRPRSRIRPGGHRFASETGRRTDGAAARVQELRDAVQCGRAGGDRAGPR